jgi:hypothetical protein
MRLLAILGLLLFAPAIFLVVPIVLACGARVNVGGLAFAYMLLGPFVCGVWTMSLCHARRILRVTGGNPRLYKKSFARDTAMCFGWLFFGFFGAVASEVLFRLAYVRHGADIFWFSAAPIVIFAPTLLALIFGEIDVIGRLKYRDEMAIHVAILGRLPPDFPTFKDWRRRMAAIYPGGGVP